ncbi:MAG TPA: PhzF family phenazine biosynthesis protein [Solirubrobacterales bacterium]|nr:PhzF family phenazine biosynthesis protein [Solirubrobacterales bacterium]
MTGATLHVLRVFCAEDNTGGNRLGVFLDGAEIAEERRQAVAADLGFAETVFVDDRGNGGLRIFTPEIELPLAGHPLVGTAWLLREQGDSVTALRPPAGEVAVRFEGELAFVSADPEWAPPFEFVELDSEAEVDALTGPPEDSGYVECWSWSENPDMIRARVFAPEAGITEDEATGSAAMRLVAQIGEPIQIRQGATAGSLIYARPLPDGRSEVGGRVVQDEVREYSAAAGRGYSEPT